MDWWGWPGSCSQSLWAVPRTTAPLARAVDPPLYIRLIWQGSAPFKMAPTLVHLEKQLSLMELKPYEEMFGKMACLVFSRKGITGEMSNVPLCI